MCVLAGGIGLRWLKKNGTLHLLRGEYQEIRPPERLVFTWSWENRPDYGKSLVTLEFLDNAGQTEMILTQERFPTTESRDAHNKGWVSCLDKLSEYLES